MIEIEVPMPDEINLDGVFDPDKDVTYIGKALRQPDGSYWCLARVGDFLCRVEVSIKPPGKS